jgi:hypothetical protein
MSGRSRPQKPQIKADTKTRRPPQRQQPIPRADRPVPHPQGWDWVPGEMATRALEATPETSNRAIADETGVSYETVRKLRTDNNLSVDRTVGPGKSYPARRDRKGADNV